MRAFGGFRDRVEEKREPRLVGFPKKQGAKVQVQKGRARRSSQKRQGRQQGFDAVDVPGERQIPSHLAPRLLGEGSEVGRSKGSEAPWRARIAHSRGPLALEEGVGAPSEACSSTASKMASHGLASAFFDCCIFERVLAAELGSADGS